MFSKILLFFQPPSPLSPNFGKEDKKLKLKKKRKVPVKIKLKRNYSSEHWDSVSLPQANQHSGVSSQRSDLTNCSTAVSSQRSELPNQTSALPPMADDPHSRRSANQNPGDRLKNNAASLLANSSPSVNSQRTMVGGDTNSSQTLIGSGHHGGESVTNPGEFDSGPHSMAGTNQNAYLGSGPVIGWDDIGQNQSMHSQTKLPTIAERTQSSTPQMPAKFRLSSYHQNMYHSDNAAMAASGGHSNQTQEPSNQSESNVTNRSYPSSSSANYKTQTYGSMAETNYSPGDKGVEHLLEKADGISKKGANSSAHVQTTSNKFEELRTCVSAAMAAIGDRYDVTTNIDDFTNDTPIENNDTLTTINKDDLISDMETSKREQEESQAIERTKLKKKKKFFVSAEAEGTTSSPKDSPKFRILKKKYRHSFVRSNTEKVPLCLFRPRC